MCLAKSVREGELINKIDKALGRRFRVSGEVRLGIGDDAALFRPRAGRELVLTCDWFLEGPHFLRDMHPPDSKDATFARRTEKGNPAIT